MPSSKLFHNYIRVQVIARAAEILRALEGSQDGLSRGQLARRLNLPKSTIQRIVDALDMENLVISDAATAQVRLGPALLRMAQSVRFRLAEIVHPFLSDLAFRTGDS